MVLSLTAVKLSAKGKAISVILDIFRDFILRPRRWTALYAKRFRAEIESYRLYDYRYYNEKEIFSIARIKLSNNVRMIVISIRIMFRYTHSELLLMS